MQLSRAPGSLHSTFYEFDYSRYLIQVETNSICLQLDVLELIFKVNLIYVCIDWTQENTQ